MKKLPLLLLLAAFSYDKVNAQVLTPVKWAYAAKRIDAGTASVYLKATIGEGWHIYSTYQKDGGPVKTDFVFAKSPEYLLSGKIIEPRPVVKYEKTFEMNVSFFEREATFQQKIKLKNGSKGTNVKGSLSYMVCNDQKCLPPEDLEFNIPVK